MTAAPDALAAPAAVLFDCDGVLIDTEVTSSRVLSAKLAGLGIDLTPDAIRAEFKGTALSHVQAQVQRRYGRPLPAGWLDDFIEARFVEYRRGVEQIPGAAQAVAAVQAAGIPVAVVSQGSRAKMAVTLPASGFDALLAGVPVFSGDDVERGKPHPDLYLHAAAALGVDPAGCVVVEDSPTGATGAHAAGMRVLGYAVDSVPAELEAAGAEVFFDMHQVAALLGLA